MSLTPYQSCWLRVWLVDEADMATSTLGCPGSPACTYLLRPSAWDLIIVILKTSLCGTNHVTLSRFQTSMHIAKLASNPSAAISKTLAISAAYFATTPWAPSYQSASKYGLMTSYKRAGRSLGSCRCRCRSVWAGKWYTCTCPRRVASPERCGFHLSSCLHIYLSKSLVWSIIFFIDTDSIYRKKDGHQSRSIASLNNKH